MGNAVASDSSLVAWVAIVVEREWWNTVSKAISVESIGL